MINKVNDMFAVMLNQPEATFDDMIMHGVTADNTGIKDRDFYKNREEVRNNDFFKDDNGKFNETKFNNFYDSVLAAYNTFSNDDYEKNVLENLAKDPLDWTQPFKTNVKDISAVIYSGGGDYARRAKSITGIGSIGDATFSMREIAQDNEARDENGNKLGWTPNNHGLFKSIFAPTMVLATWDEDGYHEENGREVKHFAGQYKLDENGDPFYEKLGDRESYGKEVLRFTDTITVDGTALNKWDFLDSDGLDKSIGKVVLQTAAFVAPLLIPGMNGVFGTLGMIGGLMGSMPTLLKGVNGILGNNDNPYGQALTKAESWLQRWAPTTSDAAKGKFFSFENVGEIIRSSAMQLFSQRRVAELSRKLLKGDDLLRNSKIGQSLSLGYMALTSSTDTYGAFKEAGASDAAAGIGMLATMGALYGLMSTDYFKDALFKGTWLDESEANNVIKNYSKDNINRLIAAETGVSDLTKINPTKEEAAGLFMRIKNGIEKGWKTFAKSSASGTPKDLTVAAGAAENGAKTGARKLLSTFNVILNRSVNEGVEETMEEVAQDAVKAIFAGCDALGINVKADDVQDLSFGWSVKDAMSRYITSFFGGFLGGSVFEGITQYENRINHVKTISDFNNTDDQLLYLIMNGHGDDIKERAKVYRDKGVLGNKNLSMSKFIKNDDGDIIFQTGQGDDNQNTFAYNLICHEVDRIQNILNNSGITSNAIKRYALELGKYANEVEGLDNIVSSAIKSLSLHTSFMDDLVELSKQIVKVQDQIDALSGEPAATDAERRASRNESNEESPELQSLLDLKQELLNKKQEFFEHKNDKKYIKQAMFLANEPLQKIMLHSVTADGNLADYNPDEDIFVGDAGFANYVWLKYHKNIGNLSEEVQKFYKDEYNAFKENSDNITNIQQVGKTLFEISENINQKLAPTLQTAEENLKDTKTNLIFDHKVHYESKEYQDYINAKNSISLLNAKIKVLDGKLENLDPDSEEYINTTFEISNLKTDLKQATDVVRNYELIHDSDSFILAENADNKPAQTLQQMLIANMLEVQDLNVTLKNPDLTPQEQTELRLAIQSRYANLINSVEAYFNTAKDENIIVGQQGDLLLNRVLSFAQEVMNGANDEWFNENGSEIIRTAAPDLVTTENFPGVLIKNVELINDALSSGDINSVIKAFDNFKNDLSVKGDDELFEWYKNEDGNQVRMTDEEVDEEVNRIVDGIQKYLFGVNLVDKLRKINDLQSSTKSYSLANVLSDLGFIVGEDVTSVLDFIEQQKASLISTGIENFDLKSAKAPLEKTKSLIRFAWAAIQTAYDGTNKNINALPKSENEDDVKLAEISENTKNRLVEELLYIDDVINTLLKINAENEAIKKDYPKKSEVHFHRSFLSNLLTGDKDNEATFIGKFNKIFHVDIEDLWTKAGDETGVTVNYNSVTKENYADLKKRFIKFFQLLRNELLLGEETADGTRVNRTLVEVGKGLGEMLDSNAKLGNYGEINAGENQDSEKNSISNLGMVVTIGALLNEDYGQWYSEYISAQGEEDYKYTPFIQQEIATLVSFEFAISDDESILSGIAEGINSKNIELPESVNDRQYKQDRYNSLKVLENLFFVQGGTGSGKTTATSFLTYKMLKNRFTKNGKKFEVVVSAPTEKQLTPYADILGIDKEHRLYQSDLMKKIGGSVDGNLVYNPDLSHIESDDKLKQIFKSGNKISSTLNDDVTPDGNITELFKDEDSTKFIFIDEAQFMNAGSLQLLQRWAKMNGVKVLLYGDKYQNGGGFTVNDTFVEENLDSVITLSCPSLGESIRFENNAKERNYKTLRKELDDIQDEIDKKYDLFEKEIADTADNIIKSKKGLGLVPTLKYYEGDGFVGEKFIESDDVEKYLTLFKRLSGNLHDGNPDVCIIVGKPSDKDKYRSSNVDVKTVEEILTAKEVHGREYDYVIIDKEFDSDNLFYAHKDLYTLIGRSKIGSVIVADPDALSMAHDKGERYLASPINDESTFTEFGEWKSNVYQKLDLVQESNPEEAPTEKEIVEEDVDSAVQDLNGNEKRDAVLAINIEDIELDKNIASPIDDTNSEPEKTSSTKTTTFFDAVDKRRASIISDISQSGRVSYNWNDFVAFAQEKLLKREGVVDKSKSTNRFSITEGRTFKFDSDKQNLIQFYRKFASGIVYNIEFKQHHISTLGKLLGDNDLAKEICTAWNQESNHVFVASSDAKANKSIVYWKTKLGDKTKFIPIAIVNGTVDGSVSVDKKFNLFKKSEEIWGLRSNPDDGVIAIDDRDTSIGVVSKPKILSVSNADSKGYTNPGDGFDTNGDDTKRFVANNNGHTFVLYSDCELLQDEDFDQIFKVKEQAGKGVEYVLNVDSASSEQVPEEFDSEKLARHQVNTVMQVKMGNATIPVMSVNTHKFVSLQTLYNLASIGRYVAGDNNIPLTAEQKKIIGSYNSAADFIADFIGEFRMANTSTNKVENYRKNVAVNKRRLKYDYKLLTNAASYNLLGNIYAILAKTMPNQLTYLHSELLKVLAKDAYRAERSGITHKNGLYIHLPFYKDGKQYNKKFFVEFVRDNSGYKMIVQPLDYVKGRFANLTNESNKVVGIKIAEVSFDDVIKACYEMSGLTQPEDINSVFDYALKDKNNLQISIMQRMARAGNIDYTVIDDYNLVTTVINCLDLKSDPNLVSKLNDELHKTSVFRDGIALNDNRVINDVAEESKKVTQWANSSKTNGKIIKSNLRRIEGSIWSLNVNFDSSDTSYRPIFTYDENEVLENPEFVFEMRKGEKPEWSGNTLRCKINVNAGWVQNFLENAPAEDLVIKSINFDNGDVKVMKGMKSLTYKLKMDASKNYPTIKQLSSGKINNPNSIQFKSGEITINDKKVYFGNTELKPLFKTSDGNIYFVSNDGKISYTLNIDLDMILNGENVPEAKLIGDNLFKDNNDNFYTIDKKLGKAVDLDIPNLLVNFENGSIPYTEALKPYLHGDKSFVESKYSEKPKSEMSKNPFILKTDDGYTFFGTSWIVNGAWLGANSDYAGGDESFTVLKVTNDRVATLSNGTTVTLNNTVSLDLAAASVNGDMSYIRYILKTNQLPVNGLNDILSSNDFENCIGKINQQLEQKGKQLIFDDATNTIRCIDYDNSIASARNYAKANNIELDKEVEPIILNDSISVYSGTRNGESISIYVANDRTIDQMSITQVFNNVSTLSDALNEILKLNPEANAINDLIATLENIRNGNINEDIVLKLYDLLIYCPQELLNDDLFEQLEQLYNQLKSICNSLFKSERCDF